jgi:hypothetical protein
VESAYINDRGIDLTSPFVFRQEYRISSRNEESTKRDVLILFVEGSLFVIACSTQIEAIIISINNCAMNNAKVETKSKLFAIGGLSLEDDSRYSYDTYKWFS